MSDDNNQKSRGPRKGGGTGGRGGGSGGGRDGGGFGGKGPRPGGSAGGQRKPFRSRSDSAERPARADGPARPFRARPDGERSPSRPPREGGEKPFRARPEGERSSSRPPREGGERPFRARPDGERSSSRPPREGFAPRGERPSGAGAGAKRFDRPRSDRPERPRRPREEAPVSDAKLLPSLVLEPERIAKVMARAGVASRRDSEAIILEGRVSVNGRVLESPARDIGPDDVVLIDGEPLPARERTRMWLYHKPRGLVTTNHDPEGRSTVFDALPEDLPRVLSIGRLDINTEGLLLLTNDGELSRALELPTTSLVRQYRARARGRINQATLDTLKDGVTVEGVRYGPVEATIDKAKINEDGGQSANLWISVQISEGKNREVRKVLESVGLTVNRLIRLAYGPFQLGTLPSGAVEEVGPRVIRELLGEHIRPENLPEGNVVQTPPPVPGRRGGMPVVTGKSGSAISDPSRKPSRVRAAETATAQSIERANRPAKKAGWAKAGAPNPRGPSTKKAWVPREGAEPEGERPKRVYKPREDQIIGPKSSTWARDDKPRSGSSAGGAGRGPARPSGTSGRPAASASRPTSRPGGPPKPRGPRSDG